MKQFKLGLMVGTALLIGGLHIGEANAADVDYPQAGRDWSGVYVGGFVGAAGGEVYFDTSEGYDSSVGAMAGLQLGFDYDLGDFVIGIVGDVALTDMSGEEPVDRGSSNPHMYDTDFLASIRGRIGMDLGDTLVFASAGGGWINGRATSSDQSYTDRFSEFVPVVGIGAEHMVTEKMSVAIEGNWFIASEYLNGYDFSSDETRIDDVFTARIGVNIRF